MANDFGWNTWSSNEKIKLAHKELDFMRAFISGDITYLNPLAHKELDS